MTDTEILNWVAEHLSTFSPAFTRAEMRYVNDDGEVRSVNYKAEDQDDVTCGDLLRGCILQAIKNESVQS
jgi:hypothetical protein